MRGRGRGRGRPRRAATTPTRPRNKKNSKVIESDEEDDRPQTQDGDSGGADGTNCASASSIGDHLPSTPPSDHNTPPTIDMEADISQLEAPTFTTLNRGPPEPMLHLRWDHKVSLIGEKVLNPMIHSCDRCNRPILIYGRMIPCKHVFCLACARREEKGCPRCGEPVSRVEQTNLGTVFMCTHGGSRYGTTGCRRTYLSQRDLQAHINHRHSGTGGDSSPRVSTVAPSAGLQTVNTTSTAPPPPPHPPSNNPPTDPRNVDSSGGVGYRAAPRTNLITVPIQQEPPPQHHPHHPPFRPPPSGRKGSTPRNYTVLNYGLNQSRMNNQTNDGGSSVGGYGAPPPPPPPAPMQYPPPPGGGGYPPPGGSSVYYRPAPPPPANYPPPQYPPPPPLHPPDQQYWPHPPPPVVHQFYR